MIGYCDVGDCAMHNPLVQTFCAGLFECDSTSGGCGSVYLSLMHVGVRVPLFQSLREVDRVWGDDETKAELLRDWTSQMKSDVGGVKKIQRLEAAVGSLEVRLAGRRVVQSRAISRCARRWMGCSGPTVKWRQACQSIIP